LIVKVAGASTARGVFIMTTNRVARGAMSFQFREMPPKS
jgi:hypothetical protein